MSLYGGIDIGQKGGIAFIDDNNDIIMLQEFPKKDITSTMAEWGDHLWSMIYDYSKPHIYCVKEGPIWGQRPGLGGTYKKGIKIGVNIGIWEFWLDINNIKWIDKQPATWQSVFPEFLQKGGKERSYNAATREIPECKDRVVGPKGGKKDGLTDSLLMSIFCKMLVKRGLLK